jgi:lauroyl/myristoyl acyltransferase
VLLYRVMARLSRVLGLWIIRVTGAFVSAGYFVLLPKRRASSVELYQALFPEQSKRRALLWTWRQYQDFARVYSERLEIERRTDIRIERVGEAYLDEARKGGRGVIVVMSHFGRWEIGARLLARRCEGVTLVMGGQADGGARAGVDRDLRGVGVDVVTVPEGQGQAFDILEALNVLRKGGIVSLAADRAFGEARVLRMPFLGRFVGVAAAPFALAVSSGAPLVVVFSVRLGPRHYRFIDHSPLTLTAPNRGERQAVMERAAALYLEQLHVMLKAHPEQWQTFERFFVD